MSKKIVNVLLTIIILLGLVLPVQAGVTAKQAQRLGMDLTPFGAEKAGNGDGTIPALLQSTAILYDLQKEDYAAERLFNEIKGARKFTDISPDRFTPQYMRKLGKR